MEFTIPNVGKTDHPYTRGAIEYRLPKKRCIQPEVELTTKDLAEIILDLSSHDDMNRQIEATTRLSLLLARHAPTDFVQHETTVVPLLVEFLERDDKPQWQLKAACALTSIASGTTNNTNVVIKSGAVRVFVKLLESSNPDVREQAVWALGNIAGDSLESRDHVLRQGALLPLRHQFIGDQWPSIMQKAAWTMCNLCRGDARPAPELIIPALYEFQHLLNCGDVEILSEACWAFSYFSNGTKLEYQAVIAADVLPRLVKLLNHNHQSVIGGVLCTMRNLLKHEDGMVAHKALGSCVNIIMREGLSSLYNVLNDERYTTNHKTEACWIVARIVSTDYGIVQGIIDSNIIGPLAILLGNQDVREMAALALRNLACCGTADEIRSLVDHGCIQSLGEISSFREVTIRDCFVLLHHILRVDINHKHIVEQCGLRDKIVCLLSREHGEAWELAVHLVRTYWLHNFHVWIGEELRYVD